MNIYWIAFKLLDKSTNHVTGTEMIKQFLFKNNEIKYYCGYKYQKKYYGLNRDIINYIYMPPLPKIRSLFFIIGILNVMIKVLFFKKPDAIIIDYSVNLFSMPLLLVGRLFNKKTKIIMDIRTIPVNVGSFQWNIKIFFFSLFLAKFTCDAITFITPFMRDYCLKNINLKNKKLSIWSSGFNEEIFNPDRYKKTRIHNTFEIFYHGGIALSRGIGSLIQAIKLLKNKKYSVSLKLIGNLVDDREIRNIISENKLEGLCEILPPVSYDEIPQIIKDSDLPVIPLPDFIGWRVSSPLKLLEYMAMAKTIVLTDIEAHRDVVGNHEFAFFSKSSKPEDIAGAIVQAYFRRNDFDELGKEARKIALSMYTWENQANKLIKFIKSV